MKNIYSRISKLLLIGIIIPLMMGCSKELSRDEAEKQIIQKERLPIDDIRSLELTITENPFFFLHYSPKDAAQLQKEQSAYPTKNNLFIILNNEGLINYKIELEQISNEKGYSVINKRDNKVLAWSADNNYIPGWAEQPKFIPSFATEERYVHKGYLTDKGKKYETSSGNFLVAKIEFGEVTGIIERKELNIAEVNYTIKRTNVTPFGQIAFNLNEEVLNRTATFTKYDDGWRINN